MSDFFERARHEFKYSLPLPLAETVKSRLAPLMAPDTHYQGGRYNVRSMYFDDMASSAFYEKDAGVEKRQKIRIRYYDLDPSYIILEKKLKRGNMVRKRSAVIDPVITEAMLKGDYEPLLLSENSFLNELYGELVSERYIPVVGVDYIRTAYVVPNTDVRITVDENILAFGPDGGFFNSDPPSIPSHTGIAVLEIKYGRYLPEFVADAISDLPLQKEAFSKFASCRRLVSYPSL